jgi:phage gp29-like protein
MRTPKLINKLGFFAKQDVENVIRSIGKREIGSSLTNAANKGLLESIIAEQLDRSKVDIKTWRDALDAWEYIEEPDRSEMILIYNEIDLDDEVLTQKEKLKNKFISAGFDIVDKNGDVDVEKTKALDVEFFETLVEHFIDSILQGYTLLSFPELEGGEYDADKIQIIPRENLIPEWGAVKRRYDNPQDLIYYKNSKYANRLLEAGKVKHKGLFVSLAPLYIYKKNAMSFWSSFQSKYGIPPVLAKTSLDDDDEVSKIVAFLKEMRSNSFAVIDRDDEVEGLSGVNVDAFKTFQELKNDVNKSIAKIISAETMTTDEGSSRAQAQIHENTAQGQTLGRMRSFSRFINGQLIPILARDNYENITETDRFKWREVKDVDKFIDRVLKLKQAGYSVDESVVEEHTGLQVTEVGHAMPPTQNITEQINSMYEK